MAYQSDAQMTTKIPQISDSDSEDELEVEDQNWDDWEADENDAVLEHGLNSDELRCLFCDSRYGSSGSLFKHCASSHGFHFHEIKKAHKLDFYKCFKLINYVRAQVAEKKCWCCGKVYEELGAHVHEGLTFDGGVLPWEDDRYLNPFLQDDAVLYSFDEDEEDGDGDGDGDEDEEDSMSVDAKELALRSLQLERMSIDEEGTSDMCVAELAGSCENGKKGVEGINTMEHVETLLVNGDREKTNGTVIFGKTGSKMGNFSSARVADDGIENVNKNYFSSYSSFGIHRDMISDKVRTDAYRQAIVENPSLLQNAVVMDVGCGTGILSLFAAQAGASRVIAVEASTKMAAVATQIANDNGLLRNGGKTNGVMEVVQGMIEDLVNDDRIAPQSVDVLVSEWMGYCLLYESMLSSVLFARDRWLKPGGAILPDTAKMFVAGFGREGTSIPFWENVYGFNMSCIGQEVVEDASRIPIVDVIDSCSLITTTEVLQSFDLATMQPKQMDFTAEIELKPKCDDPSNNSSSKSKTNLCYGVVIWFETGFTQRFCRDKPVNLSTSPYEPSTHWSQTILTFREPIAMASNVNSDKTALVGTGDCPAARIQSRISVVRALKHRSIDISLELTAIGANDQKRSWPVQLFNLN